MCRCSTCHLLKMSRLLSWGRHARLTVVVSNNIVPIPSKNLGRNSKFLTSARSMPQRVSMVYRDEVQAPTVSAAVLAGSLPLGQLLVLVCGISGALGLFCKPGCRIELMPAQEWASNRHWHHKLTSSASHVQKLEKKVNIVLFYRNWTHCLMIDELTDMIFIKPLD